MELADLAHKETELYSQALSLYSQKQTREADDELLEVFKAYRQVYNQYADLADINVEALKRGLFIQWYALAEPNYLTGISDLDEQTELKIIEILNTLILSDKVDEELQWMLDYYLSWDWIFDRFEGYKGLEIAKANRKDKLPDQIDKERMMYRGQMGKYWNSLAVYK